MSFLTPVRLQDASRVLRGVALVAAKAAADRYAILQTSDCSCIAHTLIRPLVQLPEVHGADPVAVMQTLSTSMEMPSHTTHFVLCYVDSCGPADNEYGWQILSKISHMSLYWPFNLLVP